MAVTYSAVTNIISVVGYTEGTPCNITDIYNADVAGSWGVVTRQCTNQFCFDASIQFGDGSTTTWFKDTNKQILMKTGDITMYSTYKTSMYVKPLANVYFGEVQDATNKIGKNGCIVYYNYTDNYRKFGINVFGSGNLYLYASKFYGNQPYGFGSQYSSPAHTGNFTAWDCVFNKRTLTNSSSCDLNNVTVNLQNTVDVGIMCGGGTSNRINVFGVTTQGALYPYGGDMTIRNAYIRDCANIALVSSSSGGDLYIIDADTDVWTVYWHNLNSYKVYRQYSFNLKVIDKDNVAINAATVKVWDKDSNLVVDTTTNASGVITEQIITRGYYNYTNDDTLQEKSPHLIKIEKAGYTTYEADFTLEDKTDWLIALQAAGGGLMRNPPMTGGMV